MLFWGLKRIVSLMQWNIITSKLHAMCEKNEKFLKNYSTEENIDKIDNLIIFHMRWQH